MKIGLKASLVFAVSFSILFTSCGISRILSDNTSSGLAQNITTTVPKANTKLKGASSSKDQTLRFVVLADSRGSDNGVNARIVNKIMTKIKQLSPQPEFAVMPGDLVDGAKSSVKLKSQLEYFKKIITGYYPADFFYPGVGNHEVSYGVDGEKVMGEVFNTFKATFLNGYNRAVYYFDKGNSRFFMLNTDHPGNISSISQTQLDWMQKNVSPSSRHNLYFFHEPAYPTGPHVGNSLDSHPLQRDKLWEIIDQSTNPIVFCGHEHYYTRRHINADFNEIVQGINFKYTKNVYQITVGSFGAPLYTGFKSKKDVDVPPISEYHFAVVDINEKGTKTTVYNVDGKVIDSF